MPLKQSSFNFDFLPEEDVAGSEQLLKEEPVAPLIQRKPVEIKDSPAVERVKKSTRGRMKLSDMNAVADELDIPEDAVLFEKRYYSIGTVADMFKVNQSLIRYWENEFDLLKPKKNGKGDRFFRPEDVKNLKLIYQLLRERKFTIEGAREFLKNHKHVQDKFTMVESLNQLKGFLNEIKANL